MSVELTELQQAARADNVKQIRIQEEKKRQEQEKCSHKNGPGGGSGVRGQIDSKGQLNVICVQCFKNVTYSKEITDLLTGNTGIFPGELRRAEILNNYTEKAVVSFEKGHIGSTYIPPPPPFRVPARNAIDSVFYEQQEKNLWQRLITWIIKFIQPAL